MTNHSPIHESKRLEALRSYEILDTAPEQAFDRVTTLATQLFGLPMALVSLVDADRQWFKACYGVDMSQTSRELSFCAHAILADEVMVVPDTTLDARFVNNALVTGEPHIRFYAGAPLKTPGGHNVGTLCVLDVVARQFTAEQREMLEQLAHIVVEQMERQRIARELRKSEAVLRQTLLSYKQLAAGVSHLASGLVVSDPNLPDCPIIFANPGFYEVTGYCPEETIGYNCRFLQGPATDPVTIQNLREALKEQRNFKGILLNYRKDGTPFLNELFIDPVFDEEGKLVSFVGLQNDVTEREQNKKLLEERVQERTRELALSKIETLNRLARAAEYRDDDTGQHTQRVGHTAARMCELLGWSKEQAELMRQTASLHDVGKIAISDLILLKAGKLTNEEFDTMKTHAAIGATMLSQGRFPAMQMAERIARSHHERWDGKGYPNQLAGEQIPIEGRIVAVADVFDALTHERPYKSAWPVAEAVAEIASQSAKQFDPQVVEAFLKLPHQELL